jgi:hypothetical protein
MMLLLSLRIELALQHATPTGLMVIVVGERARLSAKIRGVRNIKGVDQLEKPPIKTQREEDSVFFLRFHFISDRVGSTSSFKHFTHFNR